MNRLASSSEILQSTLNVVLSFVQAYALNQDYTVVIKRKCMWVKLKYKRLSSVKALTCSGVDRSTPIKVQVSNMVRKFSLWHIGLNLKMTSGKRRYTFIGLPKLPIMIVEGIRIFSYRCCLHPVRVYDIDRVVGRFHFVWALVNTYVGTTFFSMTRFLIKIRNYNSTSWFLEFSAISRGLDFWLKLSRRNVFTRGLWAYAKLRFAYVYANAGLATRKMELSRNYILFVFSKNKPIVLEGTRQHNTFKRSTRYDFKVMINCTLVVKKIVQAQLVWKRNFCKVRDN